MENLNLQAFAGIVNGKLSNVATADQPVTRITTDSRRLQNDAVFFSLQGSFSDGHQFINDAISRGAVAAVVSDDWYARNPANKLPLIIVKSPLKALQSIAAWWRKQIGGKVVTVTGSNGKTIVKDALIRLLNVAPFSCAGSTDSFNSKIGVPLSLISIPRNIDFAIIEAGIYEKGDMSCLEPIIQPDYGILTNIGYAHIASFDNSRQAIAQEKAFLFRNIPKDGWLLIPNSDKLIENALKPLNLQCPIYRFGDKRSGRLPYISKCEINREGADISIKFPGGQTANAVIRTPSQDIITDIEIATCAAYLLGVGAENIEKSLSNYVPGIARMEIWKSPTTGVTLINDTCSSDPISVLSSLKTLSNVKNKGKIHFVFGGMREIGNIEKEHASVGLMAAKGKVDTLVLVGSQGIDATDKAFRDNSSQGKVIRSQFPQDVKKLLLPELESGDWVLVKGPRNNGIDRVAKDIIEAIAPTRYYIDLQAIEENIFQFQALIGSKTKILAMVKALAYGSDAARLSVELQGMGVQYFGVANVDEGQVLRKAGVTQNILVMMCMADDVDRVITNNLTPVIYSFEIVRPLAAAARRWGKKIDVHVEIDTGLGRLGVRPEEAGKLVKHIAGEGNLRLAGLMTHFACADDPDCDDFTNTQIQRFTEVKRELQHMGFSDFLCHASATSGAARFPNARFDMVRLGLGMYGVYPSRAVEENIKLSLAISLVSRVMEIRTLRKGDRVGYGATFTITKDTHPIGIVPVGYHDGIPLNLSNKGKVLVNGKEAGILGRISMDSMMIDLSDIPEAEEGTDVIIYGKHNGYVMPLETVAETSNTIPYELLARIGPRVQRIYIGQQDRPNREINSTN